jgi:hypothetical protein
MLSSWGVMRRTLAPIALAFGVEWWAGSEAVLAQSGAGRPSASSAQQQCAALQGMTIPRDAIELPTNEAIVVSASLVMATDTGNTNGEYCRVLGSIRPVDPTAPPIKFEVNLPTNWNRRVLQMGGGGYDGTLVTGLGGVSNQVPSAPTPLALGYVTLGSDSGHEGTGGFDATFALNDEALANFGHLQVKKTHDAAMYLVKARYASPVQHSYFAGGSQGGHEGLIAAQKYPADFDGVVAQYPAYNLVLLHLGSLQFVKAVYDRNGAGWINPNKVKALVAAVYAACDDLDGVTDGIISSVPGCNKVFTMETVRTKLRCNGGADTGDGCLSDAQIKTVDTLNSPYSLSFPTAAGLTTYPKWPILEGATFLNNTLGNSAVPSRPPAAGDAFQLRPADATIRYVITRNPTLDPLTFDPSQWAARITEVSRLLDANSADLSQFMAKGGKLLLMVGSIDDSIPPHNTLNYYSRLVARFGQATLDTFVRFYYIPGFGHGTGVFNAKFDSLGALDTWVTQGKPPGALLATDGNPATKGRTRPLCAYPAWPKYNGSGDVNASSSFTCVAP